MLIGLVNQLGAVSIWLAPGRTAPIYGPPPPSPGPKLLGTGQALPVLRGQGAARATARPPLGTPGGPGPIPHPRCPRSAWGCVGPGGTHGAASANPSENGLGWEGAESCSYPTGLGCPKSSKHTGARRCTRMSCMKCVQHTAQSPAHACAHRALHNPTAEPPTMGTVSPPGRALRPPTATGPSCPRGGSSRTLTSCCGASPGRGSAVGMFL